MAWLTLIVAGLLEVVWSFAMKQSDGFSKPLPSVVTIIGMIASFALLAYSMKVLPLGTAYTIWTGIGAIGAFLVGLIVLGEPLSLLRIIAAVFIVTGLIMMKIAT